MRDDLAYPHIGIAIHFIMIKRVRPTMSSPRERVLGTCVRPGSRQAPAAVHSPETLARLLDRGDSLEQNMHSQHTHGTSGSARSWVRSPSRVRVVSDHEPRRPRRRPPPGRGSCSPNRMFVHAHAKNRWSPMKGLLNTLSGGFIFSIGQSHTKLSRVWPPCPSSHVALRKARLSLLS